MNQTELQQLAEDRLLDAEALLAAQRWSGAYYLAGYAVECGLKSCIMRRIIATGVIFEDKKYSEKCWTHAFEELVKLADLKLILDAQIAANPRFEVNWRLVNDWDEARRYRQMTQSEAEGIFKAIDEKVDGVMPWIRTHW